MSRNEDTSEIEEIASIHPLWRSPVRIAIVARLLWPGGVQRICFAESRELSALGHHVDLIFVRDSGRLQTERATAEPRILAGPSSTRRILRPALQMLTSHYNPERGPDATVDADLVLAFELSRPRYDFVVYTDQFASMFAPLGRLLHGDMYCVYLHETSLKDDSPIKTLIERWGLSRSEFVITNSLGNERLLTRAGYSATTVLYPGVSPCLDSPGFDERADLIVSTTMWDSGRHPEALIDVAEQLDRGTIVLAGSWAEDELRERMKMLIRSRGLQERCQITGSLTEDELSDLYSRARAALRFGYAELGPGMGSLEAAARGLPLILNAGIGAREVLEVDQNYLLVDEANPAAVAKAITFLFSNRERWDRMHQNNLAIVGRLSWKAHGKKLEDCIIAAQTAEMRKPHQRRL